MKPKPIKPKLVTLEQSAYLLSRCALRAAHALLTDPEADADDPATQRRAKVVVALLSASLEALGAGPDE